MILGKHKSSGFTLSKRALDDAIALTGASHMKRANIGKMLDSAMKSIDKKSNSIRLLGVVLIAHVDAAGTLTKLERK